MGIRLYNKVPINIKKLEEYKPYKRELKSFLVWFGLFVHPFSHIRNIGHVSYRLQFTTQLTIYGHPHNTI